MKEIKLESPMFEDFKIKLEKSIMNLFTKIESKKAPGGTITAKIEVSTREQIITDQETGELIKVYIPEIGHCIKAKLSMEVGTEKGIFEDKNLAVKRNGDTWEYIHLFEQGTLFEN